jgi:aminoglycoside phosphotransferase (APT) family kinase protein
VTVPASLAALARNLEAYLRQRWPELARLEVTDVQQIPGGASRETFRVAVRFSEGDTTRTRGLILRRDPVSSLIDTERALEYRTYAAVYGTSVPVPEPLVLEETPGPLERPFSIMAEIPGCQTAAGAFAVDPLRALRPHIAEQKWTILGRLAAMDVADLGVGDFMPVPERSECAARELAYWKRVIGQDALHPQPVAEATIRWLERNLPPAAVKLALVHGDYRSGNFLYDGAGTIHGILDWEMAHVGDPLEDLAWSLDPLWSWTEKHLAGNLVPRAQAIAIWERASGIAVDRSAFRWWQVFASLKALAIWISSTQDFAEGTTKEPILAVAGWIMTDRQNRILVDRLSPAGSPQWAEPLL